MKSVDVVEFGMVRVARCFAFCSIIVDLRVTRASGTDGETRGGRLVDLALVGTWTGS